MKTLLKLAALGGFAALAQPAAAFDIDKMSLAERESFRAEIRSYLMDNPEVIIEAVELLESRKAQQQAAHDDSLVSVNAEDLFNDGFSWEGGNPDGDITLVEFIDYRCGYCRRAHEEVTELVGTDGNIRFIVKEFPILGEGSMLSSRFAVAAKQLAGDDAYKAAHEALITLPGDVNPTTLRRLADTLGLDADAVMDHMNSEDVAAVIRETRELAQRLQIRGTPTFVMGGQLVRGYVPLDGMQQIIDEERG